MKNLDVVFMETFVKTAEELMAPEAEQAEQTAVEKLAGRFGNLKAKAGGMAARFGAQSKGRKAAIGAGAAAATAGAAYGIHKGIKAWKNRKNKK
jgi:hypothetical protein